MSIFKPRDALTVLSRLAADKCGRPRPTPPRRGADAIDTIERLYRLKRRGAISETEFAELKERLKQQI